MDNVCKLHHLKVTKRVYSCICASRSQRLGKVSLDCKTVVFLEGVSKAGSADRHPLLSFSRIDVKTVICQHIEKKFKSKEWMLSIYLFSKNKHLQRKQIQYGGGELACKFSESARTILRKHLVNRTNFIQVNLPNLRMRASR